MNIFDVKPNNIVSVTHQLLDELNVRVNIRTLTKNMESHPCYPSLLTICDCLSAFKVETDVYILEKGDYDWSNLPFPFITHSANDGGYFTLIHGIHNNQIRISNEKDKNILVHLADFLATWEGIILQAEPNDKSGELHFKQNYIKSLLQKIAFPIFLLTTLGATFFGFYNHPFNWLVLVMGMLKFIGVCISIALIAHQIDSNHPAIKNLCGSDINNDCNAVLQSKDAKITSWLTWAEVGFYYFSGSFLSLVILPVSLSFLYWINIISLPFTMYSLIYQYKAKKWCIVCCLVQGTLVLEFIAFNSFLSLFTLDTNASIGTLMSLILCFLFPIVIWKLLKSILYKKAFIRSLQQQLNQFRYNSDLFILALNNQIQYEVEDELKPIVLGNPESNKVITIISNPYCQPCSKAHIFIDQWMQQRTDIQVRIILVGDNSSHQSKAAKHMIALGLLQDKNLVQLALKDWYEQRHPIYELWSEKYSVIIDNTVKDIFIKQVNWAITAGITFTPTILVNGYKLPEPYQLEDLKYIIN